MAFFALPMVLLFSMAGYTNAAYCICNTAMSDSVLQKSIDYACGNGADCGQISQNGACFNPNTVKDHCNYAVNSYFQKKGQVQGSCDFSGTATPSQTPPADANSVCFSGNPSITRNRNASKHQHWNWDPNSGNGTGTGAGSGIGTGINVNPPFGMGPTGTNGFDTSGSI